MRIVCIGGGPAGLYFGLLMKKENPAHHVTVIERNQPYDTFGWGVVFSDATMENMRAWDPVTAQEIETAFNHWDDIEVLIKGRRMRTTGHGFVGIGRKKLLNILQARCEELGVELVFEREVDSDLEFPDADLIIASDGINSKIRNRYPDAFKPDLVVRPNRFIWLGSRKLYDAFTFDFRRTEHGWFQAHIYKFDEETSTFIIETTEDIFKAHGLDRADEAQSIAFCEQLFSEVLDGSTLMSNSRHLRGSAWLNFNRLICSKWSHFNGRSHVVLMGDAAHTAHFAIGSGTKLAFEDAIELTNQFRKLGATRETIPAVLAAYEEVRAVDVARIQNAARNAMEWFEVVGSRYADTLEPEQFMYSLLTRSQRISHENLRLRDRTWLENYERWFAARTGVNIDPDGPPVPPMFTPYRVRGLTLENRIVMSPMAMYSAKDGVPNDFHLVHFGSRALGGAGLLFGEMTCVSPDARITPGCLGLWNDEQAAAWKRIVEFVHGTTSAKFGLQLGHAGRKGSTRVAWEGIDQPLNEGNWPVISASALPYTNSNQVPRAMTRADMDRVKSRFRRRDEARRRDRFRHHRVALRARLSAVELPVAADEPSHRRIWRLAREQCALSAGGIPRHPRGLAAGQTDLGAPVVSRLDRWRQYAGRRRHLCQDVQGCRRRSCRLLVGTGVEGGKAGLWPPLSNAVFGQAPQRSRHRDRRRRRHFGSRSRELDHRRWPRGPLRHRPSAPRRHCLDTA